MLTVENQIDRLEKILSTQRQLLEEMEREGVEELKVGFFTHYKADVLKKIETLGEDLHCLQNGIPLVNPEYKNKANKPRNLHTKEGGYYYSPSRGCWIVQIRSTRLKRCETKEKAEEYTEKVRQWHKEGKTTAEIKDLLGITLKHRAKLSFEIAEEIRELNKRGLGATEIGLRYGVTPQSVRAIIGGRVWKK